MTRSVLLDRPDETGTNTRRRGPANKHDSGGGPLERVTVNLTYRTSQALQLLMKLTGASKTDAINRALQLSAFLEEIDANGGAVYVREGGKDSELQRLRLVLMSHH